MITNYSVEYYGIIRDFIRGPINYLWLRTMIAKNLKHGAKASVAAIGRRAALYENVTYPVVAVILLKLKC